MNRFIIAFTKITAFPVQLLFFHRKVYYVNKKSQSSRIKKAAIIMSNHTSVYDFALHFVVFYFRTLRYLMAEVLFLKKGILPWFLKSLGGIRVNRDDYDFSFICQSVDILNRGGVVGIFPESRLPKENETRPLPFKPSIVYIALQANCPIIPTYTDGNYGMFKKAHMIIGEKIYLSDMYDSELSEKENIEYMCDYLKAKTIELGEVLHEKKKAKKTS